MINHTTALYCIVDDLLRAVGHTDDRRRAMTDAEVLTTALVTAHCFGGNVEHARRFMRETGLMPRMLSRSRLNRRLHAVAELAYALFHRLGAALKELSASTSYLLDSFPVAACDNIRIQRGLRPAGETRRRAVLHDCPPRHPSAERPALLVKYVRAAEPPPLLKTFHAGRWYDLEARDNVGPRRILRRRREHEEGDVRCSLFTTPLPGP